MADSMVLGATGTDWVVDSNELEQSPNRERLGFTDDYKEMRAISNLDNLMPIPAMQIAYPGAS